MARNPSAQQETESDVKSTTKGMALAAVGASLWGTAGVAVQFLYAHTILTPAWLVSVRLIGAGVLLGVFSHMRYPGEMAGVFRDRGHRLALLAFAVLGVAGSQFTYFMAVRHSDAPTATTIQFLSPVFILVYTAVSRRAVPRVVDLLSVVCAVIGTVLLATEGRLDHLVLSGAALLWGLLAALTTALEVIIPAGMMRRHHTIPLVGAAMICGGIVMLPNLFTSPVAGLSGFDWVVVVYIVTGGTLFAYTLFLASVRYVSANTTGMLGSFEALTATVLAAVLLGTTLNPMKIVGGLCIIATTFLQSVPGIREHGGVSDGDVRPVRRGEPHDVGGGGGVRDRTNPPCSG